jgi:hypothetical protein
MPLPVLSRAVRVLRFGIGLRDIHDAVAVLPRTLAMQEDKVFRRDSVLAPGQRWRSQVDGHTIVTIEAQDDRWFVRFDDSEVTAAIDTMNLFDDYAFVETVA